MRGKSDPEDFNRVRNYLATRVQVARTRGEEVLVLDVGQISEDVGLEGDSGHAVCCNVLESDRFARNHALWYHHRSGAWGTEEAEYTFLLGFGTRGAQTDGPPASPRRIVRAMLWMAIFAVAAMSIWGVLFLTLG